MGQTKEIDMNTPANSVALVTGASRGIGAAIAELMALVRFAPEAVIAARSAFDPKRTFGH